MIKSNVNKSNEEIKKQKIYKYKKFICNFDQQHEIFSSHLNTLQNLYPKFFHISFLSIFIAALRKKV